VRRLAARVLVLCLFGAPLGAGEVSAPAERFKYGAAGEVTLYRPSGEPVGVALFVSGDGGWNQGVVDMAERLRGLGGVVVGIDIRTLLRNLAAPGGACAYPAGDLEQLSRAVQLHLRLPAYQAPVLVGYSSGATLVYAALAAAPPESFAGAISLGFCPDLEIGKPLCEQRGLKARPRARGPGYDLAPAPELEPLWFVLQGEIDRVCDPAATRVYVAQVPAGRLRALPKVGHGFSVPRNWDYAFVEAWRTLTTPLAVPHPSLAAVEDLPLVEVTPAPGRHDDRLVVILSGDGGWAEFDKSVAAALAARGLPVVGWNSLRYFWTPRTPEATTGDLERVLRHYLRAWSRERALLVGYSFGADLLPFLVSRLPTDLKARVASVGLLGLSPDASFEFHVSSWVGGGGEPRYATVPEVKRLGALPVTCVQGAEETDSACARLEGTSGVRVVTLPGGHHFGGDARRLADILLDNGTR
jgi:type IV secretory pathway VirJ component